MCERARAVGDALGADPSLIDGAVDSALLDELRDGLRAAQMDPTVVYLDATSYAAGEPNLLPITVTGLGGRRIMQINDVHDNLDLLSAVRPLVGRADDVGLLLTAALIVEVYSLIELVIGPPSGENPARDGLPLLDLVDRERGPEGYAALEQVRTHVVPEQTRLNLLALRDRCAAHLDTQTSYADILETLRTVKVDDLFLAADHVLDTLDTAARAHVDLGHLVIGHPEFKTLQPIDHGTTPAAFLPDEHAHFLDEPFGCFVGAGFGPNATARAAAAVSRRAVNPRARWSRPT